MCNCANVIFEFINLCITTMNQDQTYPAHWQCDTAQTIVFKWKTGCQNVFFLFSLNNTFPVKILKCNIFVTKSPKKQCFCRKKPNLRHFCHDLSRNVEKRIGRKLLVQIYAARKSHRLCQPAFQVLNGWDEEWLGKWGWEICGKRGLWDSAWGEEVAGTAGSRQQYAAQRSTIRFRRVRQSTVVQEWGKI